MRRRRRGSPNNFLPAICIAFGAGIILSLFFSLKFVVVLAAVFLVILGLTVSDC